MRWDQKHMVRLFQVVSFKWDGQLGRKARLVGE